MNNNNNNILNQLIARGRCMRGGVGFYHVKSSHLDTSVTRSRLMKRNNGCTRAFEQVRIFGFGIKERYPYTNWSSVYR